MLECCICHNDFELGGETFELTEEELEVNPSAPKKVSYCGPCYKVITDRTAGAQLLKGLYEMRLKELGVPEERARVAADLYHHKLVGNDADNS